MKPSRKSNLEHAVNRAAKNLYAVVEALEKHEVEVADEHFAKVWAHLRGVFNVAQEKAFAQHKLHGKVSGSFSLDAPLPKMTTETSAAAMPGPDMTVKVGEQVVLLPTTISVVEPEPATAATPARTPAATPERKAWVRPAGRLAGSKDLVYEDPKPAPTDANELTVMLDKTGGIANEIGAGFLGDS